MRKIFAIIIILGITACSSIKQSSREWSIIYPNPNDSTIVQVKGLYTSKGKLLYNNATASNVNAKEFENDYLFKPTTKQIIALEEFILQYELKNNPVYNNDISEVLNKYKKYGRLYTGYICTNGDSIFVLNMIEKPGRITDYIVIAPPIMAEPWVKVLNRELWYIDLRRNKLADYPNEYSPCVPIKIGHGLNRLK